MDQSVAWKASQRRWKKRCAIRPGLKHLRLARRAAAEQTSWTRGHRKHGGKLTKEMPHGGRRRRSHASVDGASLGRGSHNGCWADHAAVEEICQVETVMVSKRYMMPTISSLVKQRRSKRRPCTADCVGGAAFEQACSFNKHSHTIRTQHKKQRKMPESDYEKELTPGQRSVGVQTIDFSGLGARIEEKRAPPMGSLMQDMSSTSLKEGVVDITRRVELCSIRSYGGCREVAESEFGAHRKLGKWGGVLSFLAGVSLALALKMMHE